MYNFVHMLFTTWEWSRSQNERQRQWKCNKGYSSVAVFPSTFRRSPTVWITNTQPHLTVFHRIFTMIKSKAFSAWFTAPTDVYVSFGLRWAFLIQTNQKSIFWRFNCKTANDSLIIDHIFFGISFKISDGIFTESESRLNLSFLFVQWKRGLYVCM